MNTIGFLETFWRDLRYATRTINKNPVFAGTAILTMAIAIGGNTAMFTVIHSVLLKPLAYRDPEQLVQISGGATPVRFEELKASVQSLSGVAAFTNEENLTLTGVSEPEVLRGARVSGNFLGILDVHPLLGRAFLPGEDRPASAAVVMISAELWRRRFSQDPQIAGKTIALGAAPYTIVGVLPPRFQFPFPDLDIWTTRPSEWPLIAPKSRVMSPFLTIFGRMQPGLKLEQVNAELTVVRHRYAMAHPAMLDAKAKSPVEVVRLKDQLVAQVRLMLWMLFGAVCFVLVIACANVANLLLARAGSRVREFAIRCALGATRKRLLEQLLAEGLLLSLAGGLLGLSLAALSVRALPSITAFDLPRLSEVHLDWTVLCFAAALSIGTGLLFGLAPSMLASKPDLVNSLRARGESASQALHTRILSWFNLRSALVVSQVALSVMLLIGASLLFKSVMHLRGVQVGFNSANLLTLRVSLPLSRYDTDQKRSLFFDEFVRRVQTLPGVREATAAMFLPMTGLVGSPVQDASKPILKLNERPIATVLLVAPRYFHTLEISMRSGRDFNQHDVDGSPRVAVIDESFARRFWPSYPSRQSPVGQRLLIGGVNAQPVEIVGVAANVHQSLENTAWPESVYIPLAQNAQPSAMLAVRTQGDPSRLSNSIRRQARALDRDQPVSEVRAMDDLVDNQIGQRRLTVKLLGAFAGVALLLALIGIYGLIAYSVVQRTHEIGIRRALGAQHGNVLRLVVGQGLGLALAGVALGVAGALGLTRVLTHLLFQVSATDPVTFAGVALLFVIVSLAASYIPAHRATQIDPMAALQIE